MKIRDIVKKYNIDEKRFESFLKVRNKDYIVTITGKEIDDAYVQEYIEEFRQWLVNLNQRQVAIEQVNRERASQAKQSYQEKQKIISQMLISSGFNFDGYKIVKYSGYISGDDVTQVSRKGMFSSGDKGESLTSALVRIRRRALVELKEAAYDLGCNAVIGVDFDYLTIEPEKVNIFGQHVYQPYILCVTANGNAVCIEKEDE